MRTFLISLLALAMLAAVTAVASAENAGSDQYVDPLAPTDNPAPRSGGGGGGGGSAGGGNAGGGSTRTAATGSQGAAAGDSGAAQAQSGSSAGSTPSATRSPRGELPATGMDAWLLAFAGAGMLCVGVGLRGVAGRARA